MINNMHTLAADNWGWHLMTNWGMGFFGMLFILLFWILVIVGVVFLVRLLINRQDSGDKRSEKALDILKERYARGEIDKDEFEAKKQDLIS